MSKKEIQKELKTFNSFEKEYPILATKPAFHFAKGLLIIKNKLIRKG